MEKTELLNFLQDALDALEMANLQNYISLRNSLEETNADATFLAVGYDDFIFKAQIEVCSFCLSISLLIASDTA